MAEQFSYREVFSILVAWFILTIAVSYKYVIGFLSGTANDLQIIAAASIATVTGFVLHEMGHKFVATRLGYVAHFQIWIWGIALTLVTAVISGGNFLFGAPGAVYVTPAAITAVYGYHFASRNKGNPERENMLVSAAGPGVNLAFAVLFLMIYLSASSYVTVLISYLGLELNVSLGTFNMLPIPPLDGSKIFKNNIAVALTIALPLWSMFFYLFFIH
ncbi:MAG: hypothetical protein JRN20_03620 [Nitrososphaerota archaeon]|nr:hypothetical protein [Nitrososphaerota archaeon]MDG6923780.1 hypothetical protein [Nitrososphaerota archaeon]